MLVALIKKWITAALVKLIGIINPGLAAETDAAFKARDERAGKDAQSKAESAGIESRVVGREKVAAQDDADIAKGREELAAKLNEIDEAANQSDEVKALEEVWKVKT